MYMIMCGMTVSRVNVNVCQCVEIALLVVAKVGYVIAKCESSMDAGDRWTIEAEISIENKPEIH